MSPLSTATKFGFAWAINKLLEMKVLGVGALFYSQDLNGFVDSSHLQGYTYNPADGTWYAVAPSPDLGQFAWEMPAPSEKQQALTQLKENFDNANSQEHLSPDDSSFLKNMQDIFSQLGDPTVVSSIINNLKNLLTNNELPTPPCAAVSPWTKKVVYIGTDGDQFSDPDEKRFESNEFKTILVPPTDPLILDLTGNGIETVGLNAGIQFDQNGSGVKQGTGWIAPGNGFLVLDRNGNGVIDNGTELFGNNTPLYDAAGNITGYAANGQSALAVLDTDHDGVLNKDDASFAQLKVWQDTNQDGISQSGELQTLTELGITSINVGMVASDPFSNANLLPNGNQISATGTFTRADGTTGTTADVNLALDPLARNFSDTIPVTAEAQALPTMQGSGTVRNLNEAASLQTAEGTVLLTALTAFNSATTGLAQHAQIDTILQDWADTSAQQTSHRLAAAQGITLHYYTPTANGTIDPAESARITQMINVMESFGGVNFIPSNAIPSGTGDIYVPLDYFESSSFQQRYYALQDSVYGALAMQTRLKPYMDSIGLSLATDGSIQFDFTKLNARIASLQASDPQSALIDLVELQRYSYTYDNTVNVNGVAGETESKVTYTYADGSTYGTDTVYNTDSSYFQAWNKSDGTAGSSAVNASGVLTGDSWVHADGTQGVDAGSNHLIMSGTASDTLATASGNDILIGGAGNDTLTTGSGTNLIAFNAGDGQDIVNAAAGQNNTISLGGHFAFSDLALQKNGNDLVLDVGTSDSITFKDWYAGAQNIVNLQVIESAMTDFNPGSTDVLRNSNVENFDFQSLVAAFDQAQAANPSLNAWGVTNDLLNAHLASSDSAALGGDLAYVYGTQGSLSGMNVAAAENTLSNTQFAAAPQALNPWPTLNTGTAQIR